MPVVGCKLLKPRLYLWGQGAPDARDIPGALPAAAARGGGASAPGGIPDIRYSTARSGLLYAALIALTTSSLGKPMSTICKSIRYALYNIPHVTGLVLQSSDYNTTCNLFWVTQASCLVELSTAGAHPINALFQSITSCQVGCC